MGIHGEIRDTGAPPTDRQDQGRAAQGLETPTLDRLPVALAGLDAEGRLRYLNGVFAALFGFDRDELRDRPFSQLLLPLLRSGLCADYEHFVNSGREHSFGIWQCQRKDGSAVSLRAHLAKSDAPRLRAIVTLYECLPDQDQSEVLSSPDAILQQFLDALPVGVFVVKPGGIPVYANKKCVEFAGKGVDDSIAPMTLAKAYNAYVAGTDRPYPHETGPWAKALGGEYCQVDDVEIRQAERSLRLEVVTSPVFDKAGNVVYAIGALTDLSDRLAAQQELEKLHEQLVEASRHAGMADAASGILHNVGNLLNSINISVEQIGNKLRESSINSLSRLVGLLEDQSDLAGFVRTDPRGARLPAFLRALEEQCQGEIHAMQAELAGLTANLEHVKAIISTQQEYAVSGGLLERVDPSEVLDAAVGLVRNLCDEYRIEMERDYRSGVAQVMVDRQKLLMILVNLLRNAGQAVLKRPAGRRVGLAMSVAEGEVSVRIFDNGEGIARHHLPKLFSFGFTTKESGHGFGLHSSANAVAEMGGRIRAASDGPGKGATFTVTLPVYRDDREAP